MPKQKENKMETILAVILVIGSIGAVTQGSEGQTPEERCTAKVIAAVDSEEAPAAVEACYDKETRNQILRCKTDECVLELVN